MNKQSHAGFNTLEEFLQAFPDINFDITHYLLSYKYRLLLQRRLSGFRQSLEKAPSPSEQKASIVKAVREHLASDVPAYAGLKSITEFEDIHFIDKDALRASPEQYISRSAALSELWQRETSGTTGPPVPIFFSDDFYFDFLFLSTRKFAILTGAPSFDTKFVYCISVTDSRGHPKEAYADPTKEVGLTLRVFIDNQELQTIRDFFALVDMTRPTILLIKPSVLEVLLARSTLRPVASYFPPYIFSMGAHLGESLRADFERTFGSKVYDYYGLTEFACVAYQCSARNGLHIDETTVLVELLDRDGNPVPEGCEGELVLSSLANAAMPLLRYRTGDLATVESSVCPCGLPGTRIKSLSGRLANCFRFRSGELVSPTHFNNLFSFFPIREFQMTQKDVDQLQVLVEPQSDCKDIAGTLSGIRSHVERLLPEGIRVSIGQTQFDRRFKFERFRSYLKGSAPSSDQSSKAIG